jgi:F0F1-type ATP synthase epsilon subunit
VEKVELPTKVGVLSILPHHNPLTAMIIPGIVKFIPTEKRKSEFLADTEFLFEDEKITIAV